MSFPPGNIIVGGDKLLSALLALAIYSGGSAVAASPDTPCRKLYKGGQYLSSAQCFARLGRELLGRKKKKQAGEFIKNAGLVYLKSLRANTQLSPQERHLQKAYAIAEAHAMFALYLGQRLCEFPQDCAGVKSIKARAPATPWAQLKLAYWSPSTSFRACRHRVPWRRLTSKTTAADRLCTPLKQKRNRLLPGYYRLWVQCQRRPLLEQKRSLLLGPKAVKVSKRGCGTLRLRVFHPQAQLSLTGSQLPSIRLRGQSLSVRLPGGVWGLQVREPGQPALQQRVAIVPNQTRRLRLLHVTSVPSGAAVYREGKLIGQTPLRRIETPGLQALQLKKQCYLTWKGKASTKKKLVALLRREPRLLQAAASRAQKKALGWALLGVGVGFGVLSGVLYSQAELRLAEALQPPRAEGHPRFEDQRTWQGHVRTHNLFRILGHSTLGVALLSLGGGGLFLAQGYTQGAKESQCIDRSSPPTKVKAKEKGSLP